MGTPKKRVSSDIDKNLVMALDAKTEKLGISRAKFIETAIETELGRFNVHKENKRLTERVTTAEQDIAELQHQLDATQAAHQETCDRLEREKNQLTEHRDEFEKLLHDETDTCNKYDEQVKSLKQELATAEAKYEKECEDRQELSAEYAERIKQIASHLGVPDTVNHIKQRIDELETSIKNREDERDLFKDKMEKTDENYRICTEKIRLLVIRNWWERLWNVLPWTKD